MPDHPRRRYRVRLRRALAGSVFAAATAASLTGLTAAPALAAPPRSVSASATYVESAGTIEGLEVMSTLESVVPAVELLPDSEERLAGVRADLDRAVLLRMVTPEQADGFYAQIERRVASGL